MTKGEVVDYYESVSARLLPHLVDRPLTLQRFPQGIAKQGFMQKNAGKGFPSFIDHFELPKQGGTVDAPVIHDLEGLVYLANQNTITFHIPAFRTTDVEHPDRLVFDLDPAEGDIDGARLAAQATGDLLDSLSVPSWLMASGSKGFHVAEPLRRDRRRPLLVAPAFPSPNRNADRVERASHDGSRRIRPPILRARDGPMGSRAFFRSQQCGCGSRRARCRARDQAPRF
ncbi:MAG: hypothetical protein LC739_05425 [Actinobacteria bacterium]|nr:hypothetical protein [Actinomycetota bacterium]